MLDYAREVGAKKFIYTSTGGVYGSGEQSFREQKHCQPMEKTVFIFQVSFVLKC